MKPWPIIWGIFKALVTVAIALAVLTVPSGRFETVVVSTLVMLYTLTRAAAVANHRLLLAMSTAQLRQFVELATRLDHPDLDGFRETLQRDGEIFSRSSIPTLIEGVALGVIWVAAFFALLMVF